MAQTQKTIRFNELSDSLVAQTRKEHESEPNYNYAVNQIFARYAVMCDYLERELPFSKMQMQGIAAAFNGRVYNSDIDTEARAFRFNISEAVQYDGNARMLLLETDDPVSMEGYDELMKKVDSLSIPQIIAIINYCQRFWKPKSTKN
jgi:hypothetical protein